MRSPHFLPSLRPHRPRRRLPLRPAAAWCQPALTALCSALLAVLAGWPLEGRAQRPSPASTATPEAAAVRPGERLSDWLLRNDPQAQGYVLGLVWAVPSERASQALLKAQSVEALSPYPDLSVLRAWLNTLPVTGRLYVSLADARWLQGNPGQDPVLQAGEAVRLPARPASVTVVLPSGQWCQPPHTAGARALGYLRACLGDGVDQVDWAWVAQPDGQHRRLGVSTWNPGPQDELAPGAWVWAPPRQLRLPWAASDALVRLLATQGPAPDLAAAPVPALPQARLSLSTELGSAGNAPGGPAPDTPGQPEPAPGRPGQPAAPSPTLPPQAPRLPVLPTPEARDLPLTSNNFGGIGLLQTPTARMAPEGTVRMHFSRVIPYTNFNVMFQPLEWLEGGFRYTTVSNRPYGDFRPNQPYTDKSFDLKVRLLKESAWLPELAVGLRDFGGTGLFSSEYVVGSKRWGDLDLSLGLGWGNLGARGNLPNPLSWVLGSDFDRRSTGFGQGGTVATGALLRGRTALFGGVQWHTPWDDVVLKAEWDGNNYQNEALGNVFQTRSPVNLGLVYRYSRNMDLTVGVQRGNRWMAGVTLALDAAGLNTPKLFDQPAPAFAPTAPLVAPGWAKTATDIHQLTNWTVNRFEQQGSTLWVHLGEVAAAYRQDRLERLVAVLHRDAPVEFRRFVVTYAERGLALGMHEVDRVEYVARRSGQRMPPDQLAIGDGQDGPDASATRAAPAFPGQPTRAALPREELLLAMGRAVDTPAADDPASPPRQALWQRNSSGLTYGVRPSYQQILGGPDGLVLYQLAAQGEAEYRFSPNTWATGALRLRLLDNYQNFTYTAPSNLPRVRTFAREFVTTARVNIPNLQLTHVRQISDNQYVSVYGGLLESMYAGVGGEWLYRPWRSPVAFGVDLNHVRQRGFRQDFSLRNYQVTTGHATLYWDTGWNGVNVTVQAGRYLAGDVGATFTISRRFSNGFTVGAWATRTNVSAAQFGEGSFDKGVFVSLPFDALLPSRTPFWANLAWTPLTRDGGARLARDVQLYGLTDARHPQAFSYGPRNTDPPGTGTRLFRPSGQAAGSVGPGELANDLLGSGLELAQQATQPTAGLSWLAGAAAVAGASLLDRPADRWARTHQTTRWRQLAKGTDLVPLALGAGVGLLATGLGGEEFQQTAWTSLKAAGFTLGTNLALRTTLGRARPEENLGAGRFTGPTALSYKSGLPSNHVATSFALVTPFAQRYQMPWLYGLAATSAFGRIQQRKHWVSDAVAGGVLGYAIGSMLTDQQRARTGLQNLSLTPNGVSAHWVFD